LSFPTVPPAPSRHLPGAAMLATETLVFVALCYIGLLFGVAYFGDKRADAGRSIVNNPYVYALSLAVYCTAWTFYGSVGRAVSSGPGFLAIYIGPTLAAVLGWPVLRKIMRISRIHRITSIADFIASRYGKSILLGGVVTVIAVLGIVPYISLQLKAVSTSFLILKNHPADYHPIQFGEVVFYEDTSLYVAFILAAFAVLFGTRRPEATERHEGLVAAIALESVVKLFAFLAVGFFVTYGLYGGFSDLFAQVRQRPELIPLLSFESYEGTYTDWTMYTLLSMLAIFLLPRQFQVTVVENIRENHLRQALWLFPLYLLAINIFVLPVACAGLLQFSNRGIDADTFVLLLPLVNDQRILTLLVFIGGFSAATGMIIVETIALSTMICNNLVMPLLLQIPSLRLTRRSDLGRWLVAIRHGAIVTIILMGYLYLHMTAEFDTLVSIGLISFAAVAQFAPALLGGIFWKGGTKAGALWGLLAGFAVWFYTLPLPSMAEAGLLPGRFITEGPLDLYWLRPYELFGMTGFDHVSHAVFWSLLCNLALYIGVSLFSRQSVLEHTQAAMFVDVFRISQEAGASLAWRGTALVPDLTLLLERFLGKERTAEALSLYSANHPGRQRSPNADPGLVTHVEKLLAGAIGSASARVMVASVVKEEPLGIQEVMHILDETRQVIVYSRELEKATTELKEANERLKEVDRLKDEFISTVSHELRTPLTAIQSLAEILRDYPETEAEERGNFLSIMINEIQRLSRLINQVLDFQKIESGKMLWQIGPVDMLRLIEDAASATRHLAAHKKIELTLNLPFQAPVIAADRDQLMQAMVNLISNAVKFCNVPAGRIDIGASKHSDHLEITVCDNGIGIRPEDQSIIFEQFRQVVHPGRGRPPGSGLGLAITKRIIEYHGGQIGVESAPGSGATFKITLPFSHAFTDDARPNPHATPT
jgi:Na+/proline symporter/nitrogen-specific signal transduction histidine kinase